MAREDLHFRLRIPGELKTLIEDAATSNHRSMTAEIIARLEDSFHQDLSHKDKIAAFQLELMQKENVSALIEYSLKQMIERTKTMGDKELLLMDMSIDELQNELEKRQLDKKENEFEGQKYQNRHGEP